MTITSSKFPPIFYAGLVGLLAIALVIMAAQGFLERTAIAAGLFALFGIFLGALFAFRLEQGKEEAAESKRRKSALNRALFVLGAQHNELRTTKKELIKHKTEIQRAFNMPALQPAEDFGLNQKIDDLDFLLESSDPQLLFDIHIEQERFAQAMDAIRIRNAFYVTELQVEIERNEINRRVVHEQLLRSLLGERLYESAINSAQTMYSHVMLSDESNPELQKKIFAMAKKLFPDGKFARFELVDTELDQPSPPIQTPTKEHV